MKTSEIFSALPHVNKIWVTTDGNFHLHPHNGGEEIDREDADDESEVSLSKVKEPTDGKIKEAAPKVVKPAAAKKEVAPKKNASAKKETAPKIEAVKPADIKDVVALINAAITHEEVDTIVGEDKRPGVVKAATAKKATFSSGE